MTTAEKRDYTLMVDRSGTMITPDCPGRQTRWDAARQGAVAVARKLEPDGVTLYTFGSSYRRYCAVTGNQAECIFSLNEPYGGTDTAGVLDDAFTRWKERKNSGALKGGETVIVVTDGEPDDRGAVVRVIKNVTHQMDAGSELALSFFQAGQDESASRFLHRLDDEVTEKGAKFDIVTTTTYREMVAKGLTLTDMLLDATGD